MKQSEQPFDGRKCARCGADLGGMQQSDLCPKCLLEAGLETQPAAGPTGTVALPSLETPFPGLPQSGDQLGHYQIVRLLGQGGMGAAFEAEDLENGRRVALKVLGHKLDSPQARERFFREGKLAASINHPNSVYVFGTEEIAGTPVIVMELVPGGTLHQRVEGGGPLAPGMAVDCALQVIAGLEAAQRIGILHRDVKPSNCFIDMDGTVKIGDFGLSISTEVRTEPALTATGTFLGTPAFCSPEQLRGDELNARSDIYSVGATLFYLLTGRTPFEGKNVVQLLATVLERPVPSPKQFRATIPHGLSRIVMRCLEKQPGERFRNYDELVQALAPYSSAAPTPATLGLRFLAGLIDIQVISISVLSVELLLFRNVTAFANQLFKIDPTTIAMMLAGLAASILYYAVPESIWGASLGKKICRLRVTGPDHGPPTFGRSLIRALIYTVSPAVPYWVSWMVSGSYPLKLSANSDVASTLAALFVYIIMGLLFCTARRRNGFAAVHDLITGTRVISRASLSVRPPLAVSESAPADVTVKPRVGPYYVLDSLGKADGVQWSLGYDLHLLRKVWIRAVPPGTPPVPVAWRNISRPGRLRWLTGRRSPEENWDVFEGCAGQPLADLIRAPQPWSHVRYWLHDLANELSAAEKDGTLPLQLSLEQVWITGDGRAKLLNFPVPGLADFSPMPFPPGNAPRFLGHLAAAALSGNASANSPDDLAVPLPLHARTFLESITRMPNPETIAATLKPLLSRLTSVTRRRRIAIVAGCAAFPLFIMVMWMAGVSLSNAWNRTYPGVMDLSTLLRERSTLQFFGQQAKINDRHYSIFIATHYRTLITNQTVWSGAVAQMMIKGRARHFAEQSVAEHPAPTEKEIAEADTALSRFVKTTNAPKDINRPSMPFIMVVGMLLVYVVIPSIIAALLFRGGLVLRVANVAFVRRDGVKASRLRVFWRALVAWSWYVPAVVIYTALSRTSLGPFAAALFVGLLVLWSLILPKRGLPDRIAGTWPVPR